MNEYVDEEILINTQQADWYFFRQSHTTTMYCVISGGFPIKVNFGHLFFLRADFFIFTFFCIKIKIQQNDPLEMTQFSHLFISTVSNGEAFLPNALVVLNHSLQNYQKILMRCYFGTTCNQVIDLACSYFLSHDSVLPVMGMVNVCTYSETHNQLYTHKHIHIQSISTNTHIYKSGVYTMPLIQPCIVQM